MKKLVYLLGLVMLVSGCATLDSIRTENRQNLLKLSIGMSKQEVMNIMGGKSTHDYGANTTINNPYRSEILQGKDKTFEVWYYYTDMKKWDDAITDDELTPLVFDNGKLIGWGQSFLKDNIQKYEIRIR